MVRVEFDNNKKSNYPYDKNGQVAPTTEILKPEDIKTGVHIQETKTL